jgi:hypothetical protein
VSRTLRHFGVVLITVAVVAAIAIMLNHFISGTSAGGHVNFRQLPVKGQPPNGKIGGQGNIFIGPPIAAEASTCMTF